MLLLLGAEIVPRSNQGMRIVFHFILHFLKRIVKVGDFPQLVPQRYVPCCRKLVTLLVQEGEIDDDSFVFAFFQED